MIKLQNITFPNENICNVKELYFHESENSVLFDGYFNLFYIEKRKKYSAAEKLYLTAEITGYSSLVIYHGRHPVQKFDLQAEVKRTYSFKLPFEAYTDGVFFIGLEKAPNMPKRSINGAFAAELSQADIKKVNIGIDICTFKRETYVARNLKQLKDRILDKAEEEAGSHVQIYLIDNGKTLDRYEPVQNIIADCGSKIRIYPNMNAGGAGGFTRGMLEILKDKENLNLTHVLLMDDDGVIDPETIVRLYGFLSTLNDRWKDITVGGAMMREDYPYVFYCSGEWWEKGKILNPSGNTDLRDYRNASAKNLTEAVHEYDRYSGWWCCCYSLNTVRDDNLPLPLFLHHDDIEYGLRNREKGIVFLNGIGVWHKCATVSFPEDNLYYDIRNSLIETVLHDEDNIRKTSERIILYGMAASVLRMKYANAELIYRGLIEFLRGPGWLYRQDPQKIMNRNRILTKPMVNLEALREDIGEEDYAEVQRQIKQVRARRTENHILQHRRPKLVHLITMNGWLLPPDRNIQVLCPDDSPYILFRKSRVVLYDYGREKYSFTKRDYRKLMHIAGLCMKCVAAFQSGAFERAVQDWKEHIQELTDKKAWEEYLAQDE